MAPPPGPPPSTTTTTAQILQFLSNILSQRGPSSVPYSEDVKWLIRQHLVSLTNAFPSLHIKTASFTHNDGRTSNLLQCDGTVPMLYQNVTYNIPVIIWLMELYPRHPPLVYVNPTRDMIIKRPHPNVTPSGMVNVPYLQNWIYPSSNLVDLARNLSACFARDPPLYSQRKPNPNLSPSPSPSPSFNSVAAASNSVGMGNNRVNFPPYGGGRAEYGARTEDPNEVFKRNAVNKLVDMLHGDMVGMRKAREGEMDALFSVQGALRGREERLNRGLREMSDEKEGLENQLQMVLTNADVLEGWLRENEEKLERRGIVDAVDEVFEPCDVLSKQMIEASASDLAIEDVIYSLDKVVQEGVIPFDQYLKSVRSLSRDQFFLRAMCVKVRAAQMQAHVASMASRSSQYAM